MKNHVVRNETCLILSSKTDGNIGFGNFGDRANWENVLENSVSITIGIETWEGSQYCKPSIDFNLEGRLHS